MIDKHYKVALILLTLPLSFGGGTTAGPAPKTSAAADANSLLTLKTAGGHQGFRPADVAGRFSTTSSEFVGGFEHAPDAFVSSFDAAGTTRDANCLKATTKIGNPQVERLNGDCFPSGENFSAGNSGMDLPVYDSSTNSDRSQYSHVAGSAGLIASTGGVYAGGSGGGSGGSSGTEPTSTPIATPEPGSFVLLAGGLLMLAGFAVRRRQHDAV
jgi:hypothetical protein